MNLQELIESSCPHCGEPIQLLIDCSIPHQEYIEDCQVCCRPIRISASVDESGFPAVELSNDEV